MANITVTSASVRALQAGNGAIVSRYTAGDTITIGYAVYIVDDGDVEHADADASQAASRGIGIAVESYDGETSVTAGDPVSVCVFGPVEGFSGMTPGDPIFVSDDVGRIADAAGTYSRAIGRADSATQLWVNPESTNPSS